MNRKSIITILVMVLLVIFTSQAWCDKDSASINVLKLSAEEMELLYGLGTETVIGYDINILGEDDKIIEYSMEYHWKSKSISRASGISFRFSPEKDGHKLRMVFTSLSLRPYERFWNSSFYINDKVATRHGVVESIPEYLYVSPWTFIKEQPLKSGEWCTIGYIFAGEDGYTSDIVTEPMAIKGKPFYALLRIRITDCRECW